MEQAQAHSVTEGQSRDGIPSRIYSETGLEVLIKFQEQQCQRTAGTGHKGLGAGGRKKHDFPLGQGLANLFCKRLDSKHFMRCRLYSLYCNDSTLLSWSISGHGQHGRVPI